MCHNMTINQEISRYSYSLQVFQRVYMHLDLCKLYAHFTHDQIMCGPLVVTAYVAQ